MKNKKVLIYSDWYNISENFFFCPKEDDRKFSLSYFYKDIVYIHMNTYDLDDEKRLYKLFS